MHRTSMGPSLGEELRLNPGQPGRVTRRIDVTETPEVSWPSGKTYNSRRPGGASKIEAVADDGLGDDMVGRAGETHADAEVNLPFGRNIQVNGRIDLVLLAA